jgi:hypothetical protein
MLFSLLLSTFSLNVRPYTAMVKEIEQGGEETKL